MQLLLYPTKSTSIKGANVMFFTGVNIYINHSFPQKRVNIARYFRLNNIPHSLTRCYSNKCFSLSCFCRMPQRSDHQSHAIEQYQQRQLQNRQQRQHHHELERQTIANRRSSLQHISSEPNFSYSPLKTTLLIRDQFATLLPSKQSAFSRPQKNNNELEEYAKQYEDLYSRRMRNGGNSSTSGGSTSWSGGRNGLESSSRCSLANSPTWNKCVDQENHFYRTHVPLPHGCSSCHFTTPMSCMRSRCCSMGHFHQHQCFESPETLPVQRDLSPYQQQVVPPRNLVATYLGHAQSEHVPSRGVRGVKKLSQSSTLPRKLKREEFVSNQNTTVTQTDPLTRPFSITKRFFDDLNATSTPSYSTTPRQISNYSTMSLPRRMPVKKLVSAFNSQIQSNQQQLSQPPRPIYSTLQRRTRKGRLNPALESDDVTEANRRRSLSVTSDRENFDEVYRKTSGSEDIFGGIHLNTKKVRK